MLEPLKFTRLDLFDWVVIGGASASSATAGSPATPEWKPPFLWIADLTAQAHDAGCKVWHKENLLGSRVREMMDGLPVLEDPQEAPEIFQYLGQKEKPEPEMSMKWDADQEERRDAVLRGETVLANVSKDHALIAWAKETGRYVYIGRRPRHGSTIWGNPYKLEDYSREDATDLYRDEHLPGRPALLARIEELRGKVLVCHCYPERCHGNVLVEVLADERASFVRDADEQKSRESSNEVAHAA